MEFLSCLPATGTSWVSVCFVVFAALSPHTATSENSSSSGVYSVAVVLPSLSRPAYRQVLAAVRSSAAGGSNNSGTAVSYQHLNATAASISAPATLYRLELSHEVLQSQDNGWTAVSSIANALSQNSTIVAAIGLVSSAVVRAVSPVSQAAKLATLTIAAADFALSYGVAPNSFRLCPSNYELPTAVAELLLLYSWSEVVLLHSDVFFGEGFRLRFLSAAAERRVTVSNVLNFRYTGDTPSDSLLSGLSAMQQNGSRIIVCSVGVEHMLPIMRAADQLGMLSAGYAWIGTHLACGMGLLDPELVRYMQGTLWLQPTVSNTAARQRFMQQLSQYMYPPPTNIVRENFTMDSFFAYDAVQAVKIALGACLEQSNISGTDAQPRDFGSIQLQPTLMRACVLKHLRHIRFLESVSREVIDFRQVSGPSLAQRSRAGYDVINIVDGASRVAGHWTVRYRLHAFSNVTVVWPGDVLQVPSGKGVQHGHLNVVVPLSAPFGFIPNFTVTNPSLSMEDYSFSNSQFTGIAVDLFREVALRSGLNYTLHVYPHPSWTAMVALVGNESSPWDMAIGSITVTHQRARTANFTRSIYLSGLQMLVLRPSQVHASIWAFVLPLDWKLWVLLLTMVLVTALVLMITDPEGVQVRNTEGWPYGLPLADSMFFSFSSFFLVHDADNIQRPMARIFVIVVLFAVMVITAAYTAQLSYYLSTRRGSKVVSDYTDLLFTWTGSTYGGTEWPYVTGQLGLRRVKPVANGAEAVRALRNKSLAAYIADIPHMRSLAANECDLMLTGRRVRNWILNVYMCYMGLANSS